MLLAQVLRGNTEESTEVLAFTVDLNSLTENKDQGSDMPCSPPHPIHFTS